MSLARFDSERGVLVVMVSETEHTTGVEWGRSLAEDLAEAVHAADEEYAKGGRPLGSMPHVKEGLGEPNYNGICTGCGRDFSDCPCAPEW